MARNVVRDEIWIWQILVNSEMKSVMAVVGTVLLEERDTDTPAALWKRYRDHMGLSRAEFREYLSGLDTATALTLSDARSLSVPLPLRDLRRDGLFQPPQSFRYLSPTDPAARYTAAANSAAVYDYSDNYLVDLKHAVIVDVEATTAIRQAEVGAAKTMLDRTVEQFDVAPSASSPTQATAPPRCWDG